jgi:hypothetical protein
VRESGDIAAVAVATLTEPGHQGKTYVVTGSEALSYREATENISKTTGKTLRFINESSEDARARRSRKRYSPAIIEGILVIGKNFARQTRGSSTRWRKNGDDYQRCRRPCRPSAAHLSRIRTGSCRHVPQLTRANRMFASGPLARLAGSVPGHDPTVKLQDLCLQHPQLAAESGNTRTCDLRQPLVIWISNDAEQLLDTTRSARRC